MMPPSPRRKSAIAAVLLLWRVSSVATAAPAPAAPTCETHIHETACRQSDRCLSDFEAGTPAWTECPAKAADTFAEGRGFSGRPGTADYFIAKSIAENEKERVRSLMLGELFEGKNWKEHLAALEISLPCQQKTAMGCSGLLPPKAMPEALARIPEEKREKILDRDILPSQKEKAKAIGAITEGESWDRYARALRGYLLSYSRGYERFSRQAARAILKSHYDPNKRELRRLFDFSRRALISRLDVARRSGALDDRTHHKLRQRVESVILKDPELPYHLSLNAVYTGKTNSLQVSGLLLAAMPSKTALLFLIAHEMSHAIDPLKVAQAECGLEYPPDYDRLFACPAVPPSMRTLLLNLGSAEMFDLAGRDGDGKPNYPGREIDYAAELTADYFAAGVLASYLVELRKSAGIAAARNGLLNVARFICGEDAAKIEGGHPRWSDRVDRLIAAHPLTREQVLDCSASTVHPRFPSWPNQ